jgi:hypothetical protein
MSQPIILPNNSTLLVLLLSLERRRERHDAPDESDTERIAYEILHAALRRNERPVIDHVLANICARPTNDRQRRTILSHREAWVTLAEHVVVALGSDQPGRAMRTIPNGMPR